MSTAKTAAPRRGRSRPAIAGREAAGRALSAFGGGLGLVLAYWVIRILIAAGPPEVAVFQGTGIDRSVVTFGFLVTVLTGILFGVAPALRNARLDLPRLRQGARQQTLGKRAKSLQEILVVVEVAFAMLLLISAGLVIRSFQNLQEVDLGFRSEGLLSLRLSLASSIYPGRTERVAFAERVLERIRALGAPLRGGRGDRLDALALQTAVPHQPNESTQCGSSGKSKLIPHRGGDPMHRVTKAVHTRIDNQSVYPAVSPIYQNSAFTADSPYFYTRKDNPNVAELEAVLSSLEGARHAVAVSCGMAAIFMTLELLRAGDVLVVNKDIYGCSFRLFQRLSERRGFSVKVLDLSLESSLEEIPRDAKMVFFETPTNPFLKTIRIRKVADHVKSLRADALVVVDNTWATPLFQSPLEHGADISLHSGTKYFSGHSDVMGGVLLTDREDLAEEFRQTRFYGGTVLDPFAAWLLRRSLQTLDIRLQRHQEVTLEMRDFLATLPPVKRVYYPEVDGSQLTGYGGILFFELREDLAPKYRAFARALELFETGTGMACVTSMVAQPYSGSHASMTAEEKRDMGLRENLVRLCFGLEYPEDLKRDILAAFATLESADEPQEAAARAEVG